MSHPHPCRQGRWSAIALLAALSACSGQDARTPEATTPPAAQPAAPQPAAAQPAAAQPAAAQPRGQLPAGHPPLDAAGATAGSGRIAGKVVEAADAGQYTYVKLDANGRQDWYAGPRVAVAVGDQVEVPANGLPMQGFRSDALDRTFDLVYFVEAIGKPAVADAMQQAHAGAKAAQTGQISGIARPEGGMTVAEVFAAGAAKAGSEVVLRAKVVKYNAGILGKNWLHVQDGTGAQGTNDLVVTTNDECKVGDVVLVRGKIAADRDLGHGYHFALLIEDAVVAVE